MARDRRNDIVSGDKEEWKKFLAFDWMAVVRLHEHRQRQHAHACPHDGQGPTHAVQPVVAAVAWHLRMAYSDATEESNA